MRASGITIVGASAGSGKTHRLTQEVTNAIDPRATAFIDLEALVAVTYTRKAQAELAARIRSRLFDAGEFDAATRLPLAYLGTVHGVCLRLLQEFALDAGLSPNVDVVADDEAKLLREALESSIGQDECNELDRLAARFELLWQPQVERFDWLRPVTDIMELSRSNRISPSDLPRMAERSAEGLLRLLPPPAADGTALDAALARELARATRLLATLNDATKTTRAARALIEECRKKLEDRELRWRHWEKLARIETGRASSGAVADLKTAAASYLEHPLLRQEIVALTQSVFAAARRGLDGYQAWKLERRVVDFVDMVAAGLDVADHPRVAAELAARLRFVVVDEFQDTSPIQLALFVRLHALAGRSVWVGDRKQCIFEYAGADPALMDAVSRWVGSNGGVREQLGRNHRSRPAIVEACSELFAAALEPHGFERDEIVVEAARPELDVGTLLPPFGLFCLTGSDNKRQTAEAIAEGVRRMLSAPSQTPVVDRFTNTARDLRPGDVAILVATNAEAASIADALHARGVRVAVPRTGLLATPEGTLTDAALRWLIDPHDSLSAAIIDALTGYAGSGPEAWLKARLEKLSDPTAEDEALPGGDEGGWRGALGRLRETLAILSPREALEDSLAALDAVHLCARWPDAPQRIANLAALRTLASSYEERAAQRREAATIAGLLRHFDDLRKVRLQRDEMSASDDQHVPSDSGAVSIWTYHRAKGLEWPVVILASLDRTERRHAFEVRPESDKNDAEFDATAPLAGRWIRYWPWPLGGLEKAPLADAAERSPEGRRVAVREAKERVRLLYVGFTRARDHLVLAIRLSKGAPRAAWLDVLEDRNGIPLLELPVSAEDGATDKITIRCQQGTRLDVPARVWHLSPERADFTQTAPHPPTWFARGAASAPSRAPSFRIAPSRAAEEWLDLPKTMIGSVARIRDAWPRIDTNDVEHDVVGMTMHAFLAADVAGLAPDERRRRAHRLLGAAGLVDRIGVEPLLDAGNALRDWVGARWPDATWRREVPIELLLSTAHGDREVSGVIDLLLETTRGRILIDHKTFPAQNESAWRARVKEYLPQMAAYAEALAKVDELPVIGVFIHLPLAGGVVEIVRARS